MVDKEKQTIKGEKGRKIHVESPLFARTIVNKLPGGQFTEEPAYWGGREGSTLPAEALTKAGDKFIYLGSYP
jgi:hypothetical protein